MKHVPAPVAIILATLFLIVFSVRAIGNEGSKRPNILFVFADDWGCFSQAYSRIEQHTPWNQIAATPNFDRLAHEGVLFRHAFVTAPQCTTCRTSLLSGQYFYRTGLGAIQDGIWDFTHPSFPMLLRDSGYHAGYTYKVWSPGTPRDGPFGGTEYEYEGAGTKFNRFSQYVSQQLANGVSIEESKRALYEEVRLNFEQFLADRRAGEPFCYWFGPTNPHRSWIKGSGKDFWGIDPDQLQGKMPPFLPDVPEVRQDLADYFGENMAFDGALGVLIQKLEEIGELDNTLIAVSGDHGAPGFTFGKCNLYDFGTRVCLGIRWAGNPQPGRVVDDFVNLMDLAPTFLEAAGVQVPQVMTGQSLIPLLISEKSGQIDPQRTWVVTGRERHVSTARDGLLPYPQRALRTSDYLYIVNFRPDRWPIGNPFHLKLDPTPTAEILETNTHITLSDMDAGPTKSYLISNSGNPIYGRFYHIAFDRCPREELYDLRRDPHQIVNVAGKAEYALVQGQLDEQLMQVLADSGDPRVMGDGTRFDKPPYVFNKWKSD